MTQEFNQELMNELFKVTVAVFETLFPDIEGLNVQTHDILKMNGVTKHAIVVGGDTIQMAPVLYVDDLLADIQSEELTMQEAAHYLADIFQQNLVEQKQAVDYLNAPQEHLFFSIGQPGNKQNPFGKCTPLPGRGD